MTSDPVDQKDETIYAIDISIPLRFSIKIFHDPIVILDQHETFFHALLS